MGLTKQYLRYAQIGAFNLISSTSCNVCFVVYNGQEGRFLATGAAENVQVWDIRLGEKVLTIASEHHSEVTYLASSQDNIHLAAGYSNGKINIINLQTAEIKTVFSGHRKAIAFLAFDSNGHRLASGGKDTEIVIWDIISETGLTRHSGHKGPITSLVFLKNSNTLISSSKDTYIKFWDLDTNHCFHTIAAHVTEVWDISVIGDDEYLVAGSNDSELMAWKIDKGSTYSNIVVSKAGSILREGRGRLSAFNLDNSGRILSAHGVDSLVELFVFLSNDEAQAKARKRHLKERKRAAKLGTGIISTAEITLKDIVRRINSFKASNKVKAIATVRGKNEMRVVVSLANNKIEFYSVSLEENISKKVESNCVRRIELPGHQGEVRAVTFSSDSLAIASAGSNSVKLWNRTSLNCLRTIEVDYALCICFIPGDRHALVGLKDGNLLLVDLSVGTISEKVQAHTSELWSVVKTHNLEGAITCSSDTTIKYWKYEFISVENAKVLSIQHTRTLKLDDPIMSIRISPCGNLLAAALLDSTVKIFFNDTFKHFVSLYGHKLPVLCCDISSDSNLIVTGSADRNVKIWGLDFGDCHKSIFAHDDAVTAVEFVKDTHYFFSCGKDGKIKQWDGDNFNKILTLDGHFGECWNLSVSSDYLVSCGKDRQIKLYEKTEEMLVLSDEQEEERAKEELATGPDSKAQLPSTKTLSAEIGAESIMECLDTIKQYKDDIEADNKPALPVMMQALNAKTVEEYLAKTLMKIRASELGEALLLLPLNQVLQMLEFLAPLVSSANTCEIANRALLLLLKIHYGPITSEEKNVIVLEKLRNSAVPFINNFRDMVGVNLHGLMYVQRVIEENEGISLFREATIEHKEKQKKKRKKENATKAAAILTV